MNVKPYQFGHQIYLTFFKATRTIQIQFFVKKSRRQHDYLQQNLRTIIQMWFQAIRGSVSSLILRSGIENLPNNWSTELYITVHNLISLSFFSNCYSMTYIYAQVLRNNIWRETTRVSMSEINVYPINIWGGPRLRLFINNSSV